MRNGAASGTRRKARGCGYALRPAGTYGPLGRAVNPSLGARMRHPCRIRSSRAIPATGLPEPRQAGGVRRHGVDAQFRMYVPASLSKRV
jgi:hypothetical protein